MATEQPIKWDDGTAWDDGTLWDSSNPSTVTPIEAEWDDGITFWDAETACWDYVAPPTDSICVWKPGVWRDGVWRADVWLEDCLNVEPPVIPGPYTNNGSIEENFVVDYGRINHNRFDPANRKKTPTRRKKQERPADPDKKKEQQKIPERFIIVESSCHMVGFSDVIVYSAIKYHTSPRFSGKLVRKSASKSTPKATLKRSDDD